MSAKNRANREHCLLKGQSCAKFVFYIKQKGQQTIETITQDFPCVNNGVEYTISENLIVEVRRFLWVFIRI